jgi:type VI secretion system protein ImpA
MMADLESLLAPIRVGAPTGENLRLSASDLTFQRIAEHRSELDPQLDPTGTGRNADWSAVIGACEEALRNRTKDLQIAAWLTEAWARHDGFAGLRDGLELVRELAKTFWNELHPGIDDGAVDPAVRARPLTWLGSSKDLIRSVKACPIVKPDPETALSWEHYELSQIVDQHSLSTDQTRYNEMLANGWIGGDQWRSRLRQAPASALPETHALLGACEVALEELRKVASERFDVADAPNLIPLGNLLREIREHLEQFISPAAEVRAAARPVADSPAGAQAAAATPAGPIRSREQALRMLGEVAEYYRLNEPHSPIAALVARAARWGVMPFEQVLREVVRDEEVLSRAFEMLGIRPEPESSGSEPS